MGAFEDAQRRNIEKQLKSGNISQSQAAAARAGVSKAEKSGSTYTGKGSSTYSETNYSKKSSGSGLSSNDYPSHTKVTNVYSDAQWDPNTRTITAGGRTLREGVDFKINPADDRAYIIPASSSTGQGAPSYNTMGVQTPAAGQGTRDLSGIMSQIQGMMSQYSAPYEKLLKDMLATPSAFKMPTEAELLSQATKRAELQTSPLLSAIGTRRSKAGADYSSAQSDIEAAYSGVADTARTLLDEVARNAIDTAIASGMGRSGKGEYLTAKGTAPIVQQVAQADREKAAKLARAANEYNALLSGLGQEEQGIYSQRGNLQSSLLDELSRYYTGLGVQQEGNKWNQAMGLANLANTANTGQQSLLTSLVPLLLYG